MISIWACLQRLHVQLITFRLCNCIAIRSLLAPKHRPLRYVIHYPPNLLPLPRYCTFLSTWIVLARPRVQNTSFFVYLWSIICCCKSRISWRLSVSKWHWELKVVHLVHLLEVFANYWEHHRPIAEMSKRSTTNIPLNCSLCPKTPSFSDISHLLTHISSKSHLSHRFKLQIRSQGEPEARQILDNFETWYAENGLEDLLSDRLAIKEHKKATKKPRVSAGAVCRWTQLIFIFQIKNKKKQVLIGYLTDKGRANSSQDWAKADSTCPRISCTISTDVQLVYRTAHTPTISTTTCVSMDR